MKVVSIEEYGTAVYGCVMALGMINLGEYEKATAMLEEVIENEIDKDVLKIVISSIGVAGGACEELNFPVNN